MMSVSAVVGSRKLPCDDAEYLLDLEGASCVISSTQDSFMREGSISNSDPVAASIIR